MSSGSWAVPEFTRGSVDRAGRVLVTDPDVVTARELSEAFTVINNWRSSHSFPLNTMQVGLRRMARRVDPDALIAQRIKRISSIEAKLIRFRRMNLSQMQDIGGCRAIVKDVKSIRSLVEAYRESDLKHKMLRLDDYLDAPKSSGYRGIHLIYRYFSDRTETYNGLQIEIQVRTPLQHSWATAVETVAPRRFVWNPTSTIAGRRCAGEAQEPSRGCWS